MKKKVIVNLVSDVPRYIAGQHRLAESLYPFLSESADFDFHFFRGESSVESPNHHENPYAFKIYAIEKMRSLGYNSVFWADASVVFVKKPTPLFERMETTGFFFEEAGHLAGSWCQQSTLDYFRISREEAMKIPLFSAGLSGFDFRNPTTQDFFEKWKQSMLDGQFIGSWSDHRHDMTCGSIIAYQMGLTSVFSPGGEFFAYIGQGYLQPRQTVIGHLIGI
jgi:hypothetical protein